MIKAEFYISTVDGPLTVDGFKTDEISLIGIHRFEKSDPWTVTYLPTGTKINSVFPERFLSRAVLLQRIVYLENLEPAAFGALADLPFGAATIPPLHRLALQRIQAAAKA